MLNNNNNNKSISLFVYKTIKEPRNQSISEINQYLLISSLIHVNENKWTQENDNNENSSDEVLEFVDKNWNHTQMLFQLEC